MDTSATNNPSDSKAGDATQKAAGSSKAAAIAKRLGVNIDGSSIDARIGADSQDSPEKKTRVRKAFFYIWTTVGACILCGVLIYLLNILAAPISILIWTLVFVFCLRGWVAWFERHKIPRLIGTTLSYIGMFLFIGIVGFMMFSPAFGLNEQFANLLTGIPGYVEEIVKWGQRMYDDYAGYLQNDTVRSILTSIGSSVSGWASSAASGAANAVVDVGTAIANTFMAIGFALVIAFWVLLDLPQLGAEMKRIINPDRLDDAHFLHLTFTRILGGYIKGTLLQCLIIGVACGIMFAILGIPNAPALGVITGVLNIIPIVGPWLGGAAAAVTAVFVSPLIALITLVGTIIIQQFVYTFVSPKIMSNSVDIHPVLTLIAMILGSAIGGAMSGMMGSLVGMLLAIPAVAVTKACFVFYFERSTGRQIVAEDGFFFKGVPSEGGIADPFYDATSGGPNKPKKHSLKRTKHDAPNNGAPQQH